MQALHTRRRSLGMCVVGGAPNATSLVFHRLVYSICEWSVSRQSGCTRRAQHRFLYEYVASQSWVCVLVHCFLYTSSVCKHSESEVSILPHMRRRVFWQGSTDHRGVPGAAGRVATIVRAGPDSLVWGTAYQIAGTEEQQQHILKAGVTQGWIVWYVCLTVQHALLCWCMLSLLY